MLAARKKRNKTRPDRLEYLGLLVNEFQEVRSRDARRQVLANLANFAYDPFNYEYFRQLDVVDLFLIHISDVDETVVQFAIGGLCNLSLDPKNKDFILKNDGIKRIMKLLECNNENILISTLTTLMFLITPESKEEITSVDVIKCLIKLTREGNSIRIKNLAQIFLEDYCTKENIQSAQVSLDNSVEEIPLPVSYQILSVGDEISVKRRITAEDVRLFTDLTKDSNPIHQDPVKGIVHGAFLNGLVSGVIGTKLPGSGTIVVEQRLKFPKPCYVDSEVTISVTVTSLRKIIEVHFEVFDDEGEENKLTFLEGTAKLLVPWKDT